MVQRRSPQLIAPEPNGIGKHNHRISILGTASLLTLDFYTKFISCIIFLMTPLTKKRLVTVLSGDGIGPEVSAATIKLLQAAQAPIECELAIAGEKAFVQGINSGVPRETLDSISSSKLVLKGPLATPIGYGQKSANVTLRKFFETFANIRPAKELPGVPSAFAGRGIDLVIVRENVEDLYAGIEHMQTPNVAQCLKIISRLGSERIAEAAFSLAKAEDRALVTVATKANIMKVTEGLFKQSFEKVAKRFPEIKTQHMLIDNCAHQLVMNPEQFDVIVTTNMNGDILSDLASGLVGGLGFAPSANIGYEVAMFEAVHGTAPDIAGKNLANPTAMILSAVMLLRHIGEFVSAQKIENALVATLQAGIHTHDIKLPGAVGTEEFVEAIISRLNDSTSSVAREYKKLDLRVVTSESSDHIPSTRRNRGLDVFIESRENPGAVATQLEQLIVGTPYKLKMISNRGTQVWPETGAAPTLVDLHRCRFVIIDEQNWHTDSIIELLAKVSSKFTWMHVEKLENLDGEDAFTKAQGEN